MKNDHESKNKDDQQNVEESARTSFPKSAIFVIIYEFFQRFSYFGMRSLLSLYLRNKLLFKESDAKMIFHVFPMLANILSFVGATLADSYIGKFKTILYFSSAWASGYVLLTLSTIDPLKLPAVPVAMIGLTLTAIGGCAYPCISTFGGDQFQLPQQNKQLSAFFSWFHFSVNVGGLLAFLLTPTIKKHVQCFDQNTCYPLAFGISAVSLTIGVVVFAAGKRLYNIRMPQENIVLQAAKCIGHGIKQKVKSKEKVDHWLDRCEEKYGKPLVKDLKRAMKVLVMFIPIPMYWALYEQQSSGWTFQASRMDGEIGMVAVAPEQMTLINAVLVIALIPIFTYGIYPCFEKCNLLKTPLQRMACGASLEIISFIISAGIAFVLDAENPILPKNGECQIRMYNLLNCDATFTSKPYVNNEKIKSMGFTKVDAKGVKGTKTVNFTIAGCNNINYTNGTNFKIIEKKSILYYMSSASLVRLEDDITRHENGFPKIRTLVDNPKKNLNITYLCEDVKMLDIPSSDTSLHFLSTDKPVVCKINKFEKKYTFKLGAVYTVLVSLNDNGKIQKIKIHEVTKPNSVHMFLQFPQYLALSIGEVMFSIPAMEFSYSQAPVAMKSVLQAMYSLSISCGNLFVIIVEATKLFQRQAINFLVYAALMILDLILFIFLARKYKYVQPEEEE